MHVRSFVIRYKYVVVAVAATILIGGVISLVHRPAKISPNTVSQPADAVPENGAGNKVIPTPPPDLDLPPLPSTMPSPDANRVSVLLLGYGGAGHDGGFLSDTLILAYLDNVNKKLSLIHIPRDVWVTVSVGSSSIPMKINSALAMGTKTGNYPVKDVNSDTVLRASHLTKQAVTTITGLPVDYVVGVDFRGFSAAIDTLNGIDVQVSPTFDDPWYPVRGRELELCGKTPEEVTALTASLSGFVLEKQFPCRYEHLHFDAGFNHMNGETALKYGRSRHTSSDFARGMRQISIILAVRDKLFKLNSLDKIPLFFTTLVKSVRTDLSVDAVTTLAPVIKNIPDMKVNQIGLDTTNVLVNSQSNSGSYILLPKNGTGSWQETKDYIRRQMER